MALSGSRDYPVTRDDLIKASLQHISAIGDGDTPSSTQLSEAGLLLNLLIKNWQVEGMQLWMTYTGYIFPVSNVAKCSLGAEGGNASTAYVYTTTTATSAAAATTLTVTSITGISNTNIIGVELATGDMQWNTVSGAPSGSTVTLGTALTGAVAVGAAIYAYATTAKLSRPKEIVGAYLRTSASVTDVPLEIISMDEYINLSAKFQEGVPNQVAYDKVLGLSTTLYPGNGDFYFWPIFQDGDNVIVIRYVKLYDDLDSATQNPEFPQEWFLPLMLGLAWLESPKHGVPINERKLLMQEAEMYRDRTIDNDVENVSLKFQPSMEP